jgi:hypothetical protein
MSGTKHVLSNYVDEKLQIYKISKLHIFVITYICNQIFVNFGRIGTRFVMERRLQHPMVVGTLLLFNRLGLARVVLAVLIS